MNNDIPSILIISGQAMTNRSIPIIIIADDGGGGGHLITRLKTLCALLENNKTTRFALRTPLSPARTFYARARARALARFQHGMAAAAAAGGTRGMATATRARAACVAYARARART